MSTKLNEAYTDDLVIMIKGDRFPVTAGPVLRRQKWVAGQWVKYVPNENSASEFTVEKSEGVYATGFLFESSEDYRLNSNYRNYTSYQNATPLGGASGASVITMIAGGGRFLFANYETTALDAGGVRQGGAATYNLNESLYISENGLLCNDPPARLLLATGGARALEVGVCCKTPEDDGKIGLDLKY